MLFGSSYQPLAERLRPKTLGEVIGQLLLLGPGMPPRIAFESGQPHSCILWGQSGVGKTTIARLMANAFDAQFITISAVLGVVKDIREAVEQALLVKGNGVKVHAAATQGDLLQGPAGRRTIVFVDEVHRFNKAVKLFINQLVRKCLCNEFVQRHHLEGVKAHG